jgi:hypothetical protein
MAITKTAIISEYGAYYLNSGQNMARLRQLLMFTRKSSQYFTQIKTDDTIYQMALAQVTSLVQAFQKAFTAKGDFTFTPNKIQLYKMKVDIEIYPDDIEDSWLGFLSSNSLSRKEWPLIRYLLESFILSKIQEDMELTVIYKGVYVAPTAGTAGTTAGAMNGLKIGLKAAAVNHDITVGALDASTIYDQFEKAYDLVSEVYQGMEMNIHCAPKWERAFLKDKRSLGYYQLNSANQIDNSLDFAPAKIVGLPSMIGTDDWFITPKANVLHLNKKGDNQGKVLVEESKRCVNIMTDWYEGLGFGINEIVWTNVEAAV